MFHRPRKNSLSASVKIDKELMRLLSAEDFLHDNKRLQLLEKIRQLSGLETSRYDSLCTVLVNNLLSYYQNLPETNNSYYSQPGGLVDHALQRSEAALSLFQNFLILENEERLSAQQMLWQYALHSAALLQGIGKLVVDFDVHLYDSQGKALKTWNPVLESMTATGSYYRFEFKKAGDDDFRQRLNILLAKALMPASGFNWIASDPRVLATWLALLNEDYRSAGILGALLVHADAIAIQRYLDEFLIKMPQIRSGRYGGAGTFSDSTPETLLEREQAAGAEFIRWLTNALTEGAISINKAPLLMVPGGMLMCKEIFQLFVREHPEYKNWQAIQKGFLSLGLHNTNAKGSINSRFEHSDTHQMHSGVVFADYAIVLPKSVQVYQESANETETVSATELIYRSQANSQFIQQPHTAKLPAMQKLNASGQWQAVKNTLDSPTFGATRRG